MLEVVIELPKKSHLASFEGNNQPLQANATGTVGHGGVLEWAGMDQVMAMGLGLVGVETVPWITASPGWGPGNGNGRGLEWAGMDQVMAMGLGLVGVETVLWITAVALDGVLEMATVGVLEWAGMDQVMAMGLGLVGVEMALWITALAG